MNKDDYVKNAYRLLENYIKGVQSGKVVANVYIKKEVEKYVRFVNSDKYWFNKKSFEKIIMFFSFVNINIKEKYKQFNLLPFQVFILADLFGLCLKDTDTRKYNISYIFISKKNGKTPFSVCISLYMLILDGKLDSNIVLIANSREQAFTAFNYADSMINNSPYIKSLLTRYRDRIIFTKDGSKSWMKILSANKKAIDSLSITSAILDEIGTYEDSIIFDKIKSSTIARDNSLVLLISTAGNDIDSWGYRLLEYGKKVVMEEVDDESFLFMLFCLDDLDDWKNEKIWEKSNPAINDIFSFDNLKKQFTTALNFPSSLPSFLSLHLNVYTEEIINWIPSAEIIKCEYEFKEEDFLGRDVYLGLDMSSNRDLTAISCLFDGENGEFYEKTYFFRANNPDNIIRKNGFSLSQWLNQGHIIQMENKTIDFDYLFQFIIDLSQKYNIILIGYDAFNSQLIVPKIMSTLGQNVCNPVPQTAMHFNQPLKLLEKLIFEGKIKINKNPVQKWNFSNVLITQDTNFNIKIAKNKAKDSVDGVVALAMAMHAYLKINTDSDYLDMMNINWDSLKK